MKYILGILILFGAVGVFYWHAADSGAVLEVSVRYNRADLLVLASVVNKNGALVVEQSSLAAGDEVGTDTSGRALIKTGTQLIASVAENTELVFDEGVKRSSIDVVSGRVWSRIERALEQDEVYEVYTPTMVAAVRGTSFGAYVSDSDEKFIVGEGVVEIRKRSSGDPVSVAAGTVAELVDDTILIRSLTEVEKDAWYAEHMAADWQYGGQETFELITAHRDGFWFANPGQITVVGTGFNQLRKVEIDGELMPFVPVSDRELRVPWSVVTKINDESAVVIYLEDRTVSPEEVFSGDRREVMDNLLF